jgi:hypothetical protein
MLLGCGTEVDVGHNTSYDPSKTNDSDLEGEDPEDEGAVIPNDAVDGKPLFAGLNYTVVRDQSIDPETTLTCFGVSPDVPDYVENFCQNASPLLKTRFAKSFDYLCKKRQLINLFRPSCAWQGEDSIKKSFRIVERTDLADTSQQHFDFFAAFSVIVDSSQAEMIRILYDRFENPIEFRKKFVDIENSSITQTTVDRSNGLIDFFATLASSSATATFRGHIDLVKFHDDLSVVFDYDVGDLLLIQKHNYLMFYVPLGNSKTLIFATDEKNISDSGNHTIAYNTVLNVAKQRMTLEHTNAQRD